MSYGGSSGQENDKNGLFFFLDIILKKNLHLTHYIFVTVGISCMDDIPVKIIEKYKPPKKIALPSVLQHKPTSNALKHQVNIIMF